MASSASYKKSILIRQLRAYPVSHTICGKWIMVPGKFSFSGGHPGETPVFIFPKPAIPGLVFGNSAGIYTKIARFAEGVPGGPIRQTEFCPTRSMGMLCHGKRLLRFFSDAV